MIGKRRRLIKTHQNVRGIGTDGETRCAHYHTERDIIAIKFKCCDTYYSCYACHEALAGHPAKVWERDQFDEKAILCGSCGHELTIRDYMACGFSCPNCGALFNPRCALHYPLYFDMNKHC
ncbi:CHY zinc finger protein [Sporolactobacillus putidus]|uniref:CHY zinc finger protein n=1 Tax=Sporolactobacillus putidus TaxID=492735 RepID=UPI001E36FA80|nr:CHY zinc finger protein [Sporolactobacillus putidus]